VAQRFAQCYVGDIVISAKLAMFSPDFIAEGRGKNEQNADPQNGRRPTIKATYQQFFARKAI
jgi:hypothetical protein